MPRREIEGIVVSDKMQKTRVVLVHERIPHPTLKKYQDRTVKFKAHDEHDESKVGDKVLIIEDRPRSADKRWNLKKVLEKAQEQV
jgi:small subunit ribosomal protein S17